VRDDGIMNSPSSAMVRTSTSGDEVNRSLIIAYHSVISRTTQRQ